VRQATFEACLPPVSAAPRTDLRMVQAFGSQWLSENEDDVTSCAWSQGGELLASTSVDQRLRLWHFDDRSINLACSVQLNCPGSCVSFAGGDESLGGVFLSTAQADGVVTVWRKSKHQQPLLHRTLQGHTHPVFACAMGERTLVSGSGDTTVRVWDWAQSGREIARCSGHAGWVTSVACSPTGETVLSGSRDRSLRLWDVGAGQGTQLLELWGHSSWVTACAFSPGQTPTGKGFLVSAGHDKTVRLWDAGSSMEICCLREHLGPVGGVSLSTDANTLVSTAWDGTCLIWDLRRRSVLHRVSLMGSTVSQSGLATVRGLCTALNPWSGEIAIGMSGGGLKVLQPDAPWQGDREEAASAEQQSKGSETAEWLVEALYQHLQSQDVSQRVSEFFDGCCHVFAQGSAVDNHAQHQAAHDEYCDMMLTTMEELREAVAVSPAELAGAVTALSRRVGKEVKATVRQIDAMEDFALFAAICEGRSAVLLQQRSLRDLEVQKDTEVNQMNEAMHRFEQEVADRERDRIRAEEERLSELQSRLAFVSAREVENASTMEAMRREKEELLHALEEQAAQEEQKISAAAAENRKAATVQAEEQQDKLMKQLFEQAEAERMRRDAHEQSMREQLLDLESQKAVVELEKARAVSELQLQLDQKKVDEEERRRRHEEDLVQKVSELKAVSQAERGALEKRVEDIRREEASRREAHRQEMERQMSELESQRQAANLTGQEEVKRLQAILQSREQEESERRKHHEEEFRSRLVAAEASRDAVDSERAHAVAELRRVTQELELKRSADADYRLSVERRSRELEGKHQDAVKKKEELERELSEMHAIRQSQQKSSDEARLLGEQLSRKESELRRVEEEKDRLQKEKERDLKRKDSTIDQMISERRRNEDQIEALKRENEQAKCERERLQQAVQKLEEEHQRRVREEEERARQAKLRLEMLDSVVLESRQLRLPSPEDKDKILADFERKKVEFEKLQAAERQRQERALQERLERTRRKRLDQSRDTWGATGTRTRPSTSLSVRQDSINESVSMNP